MTIFIKEEYSKKKLSTKEVFYFRDEKEDLIKKTIKEVKFILIL
mgnify:CR=1 FL=1